VFNTRIDIGDPAKKIIDFINDNHIDLVVMCKKGESGVFNMGGTAQKVVEYSPVPVVITPGMDME
jgi:nucleotide-binding universal stress UspA family protein